MSDFSKTVTAVQHSIERRLHTGVQIYVSVAGQCLLNAGFGMAAVKQPMTESTMMLWRSAGKPPTSAAILKLCEQGTSGHDARGCHSNHTGISDFRGDGSSVTESYFGSSID